MKVARRRAGQRIAAGAVFLIVVLSTLTAYAQATKAPPQRAVAASPVTTPPSGANGVATALVGDAAVAQLDGGSANAIDAGPAGDAGLDGGTAPVPDVGASPCTGPNGTSMCGSSGEPLGSWWISGPIGALCLLVDLVLLYLLYSALRTRAECEAERRTLASPQGAYPETPETIRKLHDLAGRSKAAAKKLRGRSAYLVLAFLAEMVTVVAWVVPQYGRWHVIVAVLPLLIVTYHAAYLWADAPTSGINTEGHTVQGLDAMYHVRMRVGRRMDAYYSVGLIVSRYVFPAVLVALVGLVELALEEARLDGALCPQKLRSFLDGDSGAFEYGLLGAYLFVYLDLGKRSVRNDVTPTVVLWCLITLVVGPALAAVLPYVLSGASSSDPPSTGSGALWSQKAIWVFAGYSPRFVFLMLAQNVMKSLQPDTRAVQQDTKTSLGRIQGIGPDEAARLAEEGITEVHGLACVDPLRLMRDTRFDSWRILSWIDQALLASVVPNALYDELVKRGCWGATDVPAFLESNKKEREKEGSGNGGGAGPVPPAPGPAAAAPPLPAAQSGSGAAQSAAPSEIEDIETVTKLINVEAMLQRLGNDMRVQELAALVSMVHDEEASGPAGQVSGAQAG